MRRPLLDIPNDDLDIEERGLDPLDARRIKIAKFVAHKFVKARTNLLQFFNMVAREEHTHARISAIPHQKLFFDFVQAHPRCVVFQPPGTSKTYNTAFTTLFLLGNDPTERGVILSSTQIQAAKPLAMVRDYIETSAELKAVFPGLKPSPNISDKWTQTSITVQRPRGIRDASLSAVGMGGALPGSRLSWMIVDDIINLENSESSDQRKKVIDFFDVSALSRMDPSGFGKGGRVIVTNTAHHELDLQHYLMRKGWPALRMSIEGDVYLYNTEWDSPHIRPSVHGPKKLEGPYRLVGNDAYAPGGFDEHDEIPLWPKKFPVEEIRQLKRNHSAKRYAQLYQQACRDEASQRCKDSWIEACKERGRGLNQLHRYTGGNLVTTGVDLAFTEDEKNDEVAFVTVEFLPDGSRRLLEVLHGQWDSPTVVDMIIDIEARFGSMIRVENNAAQNAILQFARKSKKSVRVMPHTTGKNKAHPEYGVEGLFIEVRNGAWIFPCDQEGNPDPEVEWLLEGMTSYDPARHTHDGLMALWFAVEQGRHASGFKNLGNGSGIGGLGR